MKTQQELADELAALVAERDNLRRASKEIAARLKRLRAAIGYRGRIAPKEEFPWDEGDYTEEP